MTEQDRNLLRTNCGLHILEGGAFFRRYPEIGSVARLKAVLDQEDLRLPIRMDGTGKATGGGLLAHDSQGEN